MHEHNILPFDAQAVRKNSRRTLMVDLAALQRIPNRTAMLVYMAVRSHCRVNALEHCVTSVERLRAETGLSRASLYRGLGELRTLGLIEGQQRRDGRLVLSQPLGNYFPDPLESTFSNIGTCIDIDDREDSSLRSHVVGVGPGELLGEPTREVPVGLTVSNVTVGSSDPPQRRAKRTPPTNVKRFADHCAQLARYVTQKAHYTGKDGQIWSGLFTQYGEELLDVIADTVRNRDRIAFMLTDNRRITAQVVAHYAKTFYESKADRALPPEIVIEQQYTLPSWIVKNGIVVDETAFANHAQLLGVSPDELRGKIGRMQSSARNE